MSDKAPVRPIVLKIIIIYNCYTGGVSFLEADDEISIRDLEVGRNSVIRPAHTFFGLIQLSGLEI